MSHALKYLYSNGKLEGKQNLIKVIKRDPLFLEPFVILVCEVWFNRTFATSFKRRKTKRKKETPKHFLRFYNIWCCYSFWVRTPSIFLYKKTFGCPIIKSLNPIIGGEPNVQYKNIKYKDNCLDKTIKQILTIHDSNITFPKDAVSKEKVHDRIATVFTGRLSYPSPRCECCGYDSVIHHGYKDSWIQWLPYQEVSPSLPLYNQRFYCKQCHTIPFQLKLIMSQKTVLSPKRSSLRSLLI